MKFCVLISNARKQSLEYLKFYNRCLINEYLWNTGLVFLLRSLHTVVKLF